LLRKVVAPERVVAQECCCPRELLPKSAVAAESCCQEIFVAQKRSVLAEH